MVWLVVARKPRRRDGRRGRHPGVPLDAYVACSATSARGLQMGGHAREYARQRQPIGCSAKSLSRPACFEEIVEILNFNPKCFTMTS